MGHKPTGAGKSSFGLVDAGKLFSELQLRPGDVFLDLVLGHTPWRLQITSLTMATYMPLTSGKRASNR